MQINQTAVSLNVDDVAASADFARTHFGFTEQMAAEGFVSLAHPSAGVNVIFLATGLPTFKPAQIAGSAGQGLLLVFVVDDVDAEYGRLRDGGAQVVTPPETEPWGERFCQFADPNGLIWQLVQWVDAG
ncbi:Glyoxalase/bleomycin resistance protein/dioxygenase [Gordonia bronchialis DSM 43247]|uniref:Glyoxalase/bleomycin resistance protein/dioxygenase n=1 Tax=Gordonia bronchialis (strain ATCC 25592 / DSM 43247 / BCRC 13721 / JCM 3198 / KCTC 3076 / NBRC 16047 / NCTC 10667) TaxID=526226 RepID=D0L826_GORB4|nr:VOC family protein [Gordonia bronchialis]ACY21921.1 Glyoxalase/bleomycin resistance protein/dioxygenase [Gordonia bronchialis DSM 43247]MCC3324707.1 VOC family protein [Gordonia bronchialis]QGS24496.1 glyoxalase [Gordonia bronchialis]STQ64823.1 Predicted enzyme related to lactoylglutathione lyase [Gordonia bronchialis]